MRVIVQNIYIYTFFSECCPCKRKPYEFDGVVKHSIYRTLAYVQAFDVPYVRLQAWPKLNLVSGPFSLAIYILLREHQNY